MTDKNVTPKASSPTADHGQKAMQKAVDETEDTGVLGIKVDPTPDSHYSVAGVTSGKPTPETDEKAASKADEASGI